MPVYTDDKTVFVTASVRPEDDKKEFYEPGERCRSCCPGHTKSRRPKMSEDQDVVTCQIDGDRKQARLHGHYGLSCFAQSIRIHCRKCKGQERCIHDMQVLFRILHGQHRAASGTVFMQIELNELRAAGSQDQKSSCRDDQGHQDFRAESIADPFFVSFSVILSRKNADSCKSPKHNQIKDKCQLIDNSNA